MKRYTSTPLANHVEEEVNQITTLRTAIREGMESGRAVDFDPKKHIEKLKQHVRKQRT